VKSINLTVKKGQTTVLIGPSGCGKSTILRLVIGLISPDSGTIEFDGEQILLETALQLRRKMGYVIQEGGLFPHLTTCKNITLRTSYLGWSDIKIDKRLAELIELTQFPADCVFDKYR
jgi:osmoprotectant transport system ATP-binding protein